MNLEPVVILLYEAVLRDAFDLHILSLIGFEDRLTIEIKFVI